MSAKSVIISIALLADPIINAYEAGHALFKRAAEAMHAVETEGAITDGSKKKAPVIDYVKSIVMDMKADWSTWRLLISEFIEKLIGIYNAIIKR